MVGNISDAFQVTQVFNWKSIGETETEKSHKLGFREMQDLAVGARMLKPCNCGNESDPPDTSAWIDERLQLSKVSKVWTGPETMAPSYTSEWPKTNDGKYELPERVFKILETISGEVVPNKRLWFYVTDNPAARWLQLDDLLNSCEERKCSIYIRGRHTCLKCAFDNTPPDALQHQLGLL